MQGLLKMQGKSEVQVMSRACEASYAQEVVPEFPKVGVQLLLDLLQELRDGVTLANCQRSPVALPIPVAVCDLERLVFHKLHAHMPPSVTSRLRICCKQQLRHDKSRS